MGKIHRVSPVGPGVFSLGNKGLDVLVGLEEDIGGEVDIDGLFAHVLDLVQVGLHGAGPVPKGDGFELQPVAPDKIRLISTIFPLRHAI